ncbi:hypothetical protein BH10PSE12_BH10PSE12_26190 [soil metagenome]
MEEPDRADMPQKLEVRWDTADNMGWDLQIHVNDGGSLLLALIHRSLIETAAPDVEGDMVTRAETIRDTVEAAIASAYRNRRFSSVYEAGSAFAMHRGLTITAADF